MDENEICHRLEIEMTVLNVWVEQKWLVPTAPNKRHFRDADVARGRLILDLTKRMGVNEAGVDVVMDLLDQVYGLRGTLRDLTAAIREQDAEVQRRILSSVGISESGDGP
jgi:chaperone modulatory protein CbpM